MSAIKDAVGDDITLLLDRGVRSAFLDTIKALELWRRLRPDRPRLGLGAWRARRGGRRPRDFGH